MSMFLSSCSTACLSGLSWELFSDGAEASSKETGAFLRPIISHHGDDLTFALLHLADFSQEKIPA